MLSHHQKCEECKFFQLLLFTTLSLLWAILKSNQYLHQQSNFLIHIVLSVSVSVLLQGVFPSLWLWITVAINVCNLLCYFLEISRLLLGCSPALLTPFNTQHKLNHPPGYLDSLSLSNTQTRTCTHAHARMHALTHWRTHARTCLVKKLLSACEHLSTLLYKQYLLKCTRQHTSLLF